MRVGTVARTCGRYQMPAFEDRSGLSDRRSLRLRRRACGGRRLDQALWCAQRFGIDLDLGCAQPFNGQADDFTVAIPVVHAQTVG